MILDGPSLPAGQGVPHDLHPVQQQAPPSFDQPETPLARIGVHDVTSLELSPLKVEMAFKRPLLMEHGKVTFTRLPNSLSEKPSSQPSPLSPSRPVNTFNRQKCTFRVQTKSTS